MNLKLYLTQNEVGKYIITKQSYDYSSLENSSKRNSEFVARSDEQKDLRIPFLHTQNFNICISYLR